MHANDAESNRIAECFRGKSILLTGFTGFIGKLVVEKILRLQVRLEAAMPMWKCALPLPAWSQDVASWHACTNSRVLAAPMLPKLQPDVGTIYLVIQEKGDVSAAERLQHVGAHMQLIVHCHARNPCSTDGNRAHLACLPLAPGCNYCCA